ncbi:hypothetical protein WJX84_004200 [Apatococcus fuscideae]|uniref:Histone deacetylase complex subunit SAP30 Sin3 binding domain-containing protein n=1 Tax=Apatococcus fuscideae TaxID=2026836 RepID=A0AAW1SVK3_9CHLO
MNLHHHVPASLGSYGQPVPDTGNCLLPVWRHQPANVRESGTDISSANKSSDDWTPHSHVKVSGNHRTSTYLIGCTAEVRSCAKTGGWVTLIMDRAPGEGPNAERKTVLLQRNALKFLRGPDGKEEEFPPVVEESMEKLSPGIQRSFRPASQRTPKLRAPSPGPQEERIRSRPTAGTSKKPPCLALKTSSLKKYQAFYKLKPETDHHLLAQSVTRHFNSQVIEQEEVLLAAFVCAIQKSKHQRR